MNNYKNDNNKILKTLTLSITISLAFIFLAILFSQIGDSYKRQSVYATAEVTASSTPGGESDTKETDSENGATPSPVVTASPSDDNTGTSESPDATDKNDSTESPSESSDIENTDSAEPADTENPSATNGTTTPSGTENPDSTESVSPENTDSPLPGVTETPAIITPSPTLPELEEPFVSGNVVIDVEEGKQSATNIPKETSGTVNNGDVDELLELTPTPIGNVEDKGGFSVFFDILVYVFIGCAVLTAGYCAFIGVKLFLKKKKEKESKNE